MAFVNTIVGWQQLDAKNPNPSGNVAELQRVRQLGKRLNMQPLGTAHTVVQLNMDGLRSFLCTLSNKQLLILMSTNRNEDGESHEALIQPMLQFHHRQKTRPKLHELMKPMPLMATVILK